MDETITQPSAADNQVNAHKDVRDDPVIKQILARVSNVEARQDQIELRQADFEQSVLLVRGLAERMHTRQDQIEGYLTKIIEQNDALYTALVPPQES